MTAIKVQARVQFRMIASIWPNVLPWRNAGVAGDAITWCSTARSTRAAT
ncbi:hypothetical protein [Rhizobium bangladeshense]|nr:hypothetical protein [Rhizobium bangladeshense]